MCRSTPGERAKDAVEDWRHELEVRLGRSENQVDDYAGLSLHGYESDPLFERLAGFPDGKGAGQIDSSGGAAMKRERLRAVEELGLGVALANVVLKIKKISLTLAPAR